MSLSSAYLINFANQAAPGQTVVAEFAQPEHVLALSQEISLSDLPGNNDVPAGDDSLHVLFVPSGSPEAQHGRAWVSDLPGDGSQAPLELVVRADHILWRPGRAVMIGAADRLESTLAGLVYFSYCETKLSRLEQEIESNWQTAISHVDLTHQVNPQAFKRQGQVNAMTAWAALARIRLTLLERQLEMAAAKLSGQAQKIALELINHASCTDRLEAVDTQLEVYEDLYESANDRILEYQCFLREYYAELWIIVILVAELALIVIELYMTFAHK